MSPGQLLCITPLHFELLIENTLPGLYTEIDCFYYGSPLSKAPAGLQAQTHSGRAAAESLSGKVRLLVIKAFHGGPKDFIYLNLHADISKGEILSFKAEKPAKNYFNKQKNKF